MLLEGAMLVVPRTAERETIVIDTHQGMGHGAFWGATCFTSAPEELLVAWHERCGGEGDKSMLTLCKGKAFGSWAKSWSRYLYEGPATSGEWTSLGPSSNHLPTSLE